MPMHWMTRNYAGVDYNNKERTYYRFSSMHPGPVVNFALADGSVKGISLTVDKQLLLQLSGRNDGEAMSSQIE